MLKRIMMGKAHRERRRRLEWPRYEYTIWRWADDTWEVDRQAEVESDQCPRVLARNLLERWLNDHLGDLPGGRIINGGGGRLPEGVRREKVYIQIYGLMGEAYIAHLAEDS